MTRNRTQGFWKEKNETLLDETGAPLSFALCTIDIHPSPHTSSSFLHALHNEGR